MPVKEKRKFVWVREAKKIATPEADKGRTGKKREYEKEENT